MYSVIEIASRLNVSGEFLAVMQKIYLSEFEIQADFLFKHTLRKFCLKGQPDVLFRVLKLVYFIIFFLAIEVLN